MNPIKGSVFTVPVGMQLMDDGVFLRKARKQHRCQGGHDGSQHLRCDAPIVAGEYYIEYVGESSPFQSGRRYHIECARQQGLWKVAA